VTELSVQSWASAGGKRAKADVATERWDIGYKLSDVLVNEPRSEAKVVPMKLIHCGRPREKLSPKA